MDNCEMLSSYKALVRARKDFMDDRVGIIEYVKQIDAILDEMDTTFLTDCPAVRPLKEVSDA